MRVIILAAMLALTACAHQPCTYDQFLTDANCK